MDLRGDVDMANPEVTYVILEECEWAAAAERWDARLSCSAWFRSMP